MHTSLLVSYRRARVMIDCGLDWLGKFERLRPHAIVLTHAHPDHAWGLRNGAPCPVYAPQKTWDTLQGCTISKRRVIEEHVPTKIRGISFEAFAVEHSIRAPAVAYRIIAGAACFVYAPDVLYIPERTAAMKEAQCYIGDGATLTRSFVRRRGDKLIGHATVKTQLGWCAKESVPRAIITHCGSEIVARDEREIEQVLQAIATERGVPVKIACDGMKLSLP